MSELDLEAIKARRNVWHPDWQRNADRDALIAEVERLWGETSSTYCAYCGAVFSVDAPDATQAVGDHIETCERHPMHALKDRIAALEKALRWAYRWIADAHQFPDGGDPPCLVDCPHCKRLREVRAFLTAPAPEAGTEGAPVSTVFAECGPDGPPVCIYCHQGISKGHVCGCHDEE